LGIQLYNNHLEPEVVLLGAKAGARWIRNDLNWSNVEPQNTIPESFRWSSTLDAWLAEVSSYGIKVILTVRSNPSWAATYAGGPIDLVEIGEFVEFMEAAVARYSVPPYNVEYWEFYNEPDNGSEFYAEAGWGYWGNEPEAYADMLAAVYGPMKAVDPEAQIVFGGIAYDRWDSMGGPFVELFLDGVLFHGGGDYFDVMNFHYYPSFHHNWDEYGQGIIGKATYIQDKLAFYAVPPKPLICTEAGLWSSVGPEPGGSDELQSRYVVQLFTRSMATDLQTTIWFQFVDDGELGSWTFGLLDPELNPKLSYYAYQVVAQNLAPTDYERTLTSGETGSEEIEAYQFIKADGVGRVVVAWTNDELVHSMPLQTAELTVVDKFGTEATIRDGDDGQWDGYVHVDIGPSPLYVHVP
jgi:hypothetical protein